MKMYFCAFVTLLFYSTVTFSQVDTLQVSKTNLGSVASNSSEEVISQAIVKATTKIIEKPDNPENYRTRGILYLGKNEWELAILDFKKVIEINTSFVAEAYYFKGLALMSLNRTNCDDLITAKKMGYDGEWQNLSFFCPDLK